MALPLAAHWWAVPGALMAHWVWLLPAEVAAPVDLGWLARAELTLYGLNRLADASIGVCHSQQMGHLATI